MKVHLNKISGIADAIVSLHMSKRSWSRTAEQDIYAICDAALDQNGKLNAACDTETAAKFQDYMNMLVKWGRKHTTLLRYVDFTCTVEGMHRGGQDDWDAHAKRFNNRILRSSTRLASFDYEMSDWYVGKIIPTDSVLADLGIELPERIEKDGVFYTKAVNGYIREDLASQNDVKRGLYMLSIPSNFIFKCDITEWSHVYKERGEAGTAHPEVKECCEGIADQLVGAHLQFDRKLFESIIN
ncbi:MAG: hypothetical protein FWG65_13475 [Turicibacter sp.]|nr:hypothetical protein [Turicibacter sp.]